MMINLESIDWEEIIKPFLGLLLGGGVALGALEQAKKDLKRMDEMNQASPEKKS